LNTVAQSQDCILAVLRPLPAETVPLAQACGRFAAEPLSSYIDLPPHDNSAMDGYAVRAEDLAAASAQTPVALRVLGAAPAGFVFDTPVRPGTCLRVFTGSILPPGADAVVMQEDVQQDPRNTQCVLFAEKAPPWQNVRLRGEDAKAGATIVESGEKLTAPRLSFLAAAGVSSVRAARRPVAGLLATGDELRQPPEPLPPGAIYESNRAGLAALAQQAGAIPRLYPLVPDDLKATKAALEQAFEQCDVVFSIGGVSVGGMDWVKPAFAACGGQLDFWRVAMRPGKPFAFGRRAEKLFFGLPGNPASALVTFFILARPALMRLQGARDVFPRTFPATLSEPLANEDERRLFARVALDARGAARLAGSQSSHILSALARSSGLVEIPPKTTFPAGAIVPFMPWD
jgi:molybdopterin molybdotransferase